MKALQGPAGTTAAVDPLAKLPKIASPELVRPIHAIAVDAAGKVAALALRGSVELVDAVTSKLLRKVEGIAGKPGALGFSEDGAMLFVAAGERRRQRCRLCRRAGERRLNCEKVRRAS